MTPPPAALARAALWPLAVLAAYLLGWAVSGEAVRQPLVNGLLHFAGGCAMAHLAAAVLTPLVRSLPDRARTAWLAVGCLALTTTVAVSWEFLECLVARLLGVRGPSDSADTLLDIALGMAGATACALGKVATSGGRRGQGPLQPALRRAAIRASSRSTHSSTKAGSSAPASRTTSSTSGGRLRRSSARKAASPAGSCSGPPDTP